MEQNSSPCGSTIIPGGDRSSVAASMSYAYNNAVRGSDIALQNALEALGEPARWALVPDALALPAGCQRLAAEPSQWPQLTGPGVWLVPPGSTRAARQHLAESLYARTSPGIRVSCTATDGSARVLADLLVRHFEPRTDAARRVVVSDPAALPWLTPSASHRLCRWYMTCSTSATEKSRNEAPLGG